MELCIFINNFKIAIYKIKIVLFEYFYKLPIKNYCF